MNSETTNNIDDRLFSNLFYLYPNRLVPTSQILHSLREIKKIIKINIPSQHDLEVISVLTNMSYYNSDIIILKKSILKLYSERTT